MNALILVDIQNDFTPGGALAVPGGHEIIPVVNGLQPFFPMVVATQDWHPANHGSFAANHPGRQPGERIDLYGLEQILWPVHCVQGTPGSEFVPGLVQNNWARVFAKGEDPTVDSYSGFFDNGRRHSTGLSDYLLRHNVTHVFIAGLATDYCVKFTALDARTLGFRTYIITDACRGVNLKEGDVEKALEEASDAGVKLITSNDFMDGRR